MALRPDETWHRLLQWTYGQAPSERLAAQILISEGYESVDPSHPLGGPDGGKDAVCKKDGKKWVMAAYLPRGQQPFSAIKKKFLDDLDGMATNNADGLVFVTNQELRLAERDELVTAAGVRIWRAAWRSAASQRLRTRSDEPLDSPSSDHGLSPAA